jgi:hypothetical protein
VRQLSNGVKAIFLMPLMVAITAFVTTPILWGIEQGVLAGIKATIEGFTIEVHEIIALFK